MQFHIARTVRDRLYVGDLLFSYTGNVVFANVAASRKLAQALNDARTKEVTEAGGTLAPHQTFNPAPMYAMALIHHINHPMVAR